MFPYSNHFSSESAGFLGGLLGLGGVALAAFRGGKNVLAGFLVEDFELIDVAFEFAGVRAYEGVAFSHLHQISAVLGT